MKSVLTYALSAALSVALLVVAPVRADNKMMKSDCASRHAGMMRMMHDSSMDAKMTSADADHMTVMMMMSGDKMMVAMGKYEMACGKDAATKTHAKASMEKAQDDLNRLLGGGH